MQNDEDFGAVVVIFQIELFLKGYEEDLIKRLESIHSVSILIFSKCSLEELEIYS